MRHQEVDHFLDRLVRGDAEVVVEPHGDVVGRGLRARIGPFQVLADDELQLADQRGLHGGHVHLAVALAGMAIADLEQGAGDEDRQEQGGSFDQLLVVHIAAVDGRRGAVIAAEGGRRRYAHAAEEGVQRDGDAGRELSGHMLAVQRNDLGAGVGEVVGQQAGAIAEAVIGVGDGKGDLPYADLQHVAGLRALDIDRAGQDVASGAPLGQRDMIEHVAQAGLYLVRRHAVALKPRGAVGQDGVEDHRVARADAQHRLGRWIVVAPFDGLGGDLQGVGLLGASRAAHRQPR